jgi:hypothetical protein
MTENNLGGVFSFKMNQQFDHIYGIGGVVHSFIRGPMTITIQCDLISDREMSVEEYKEEVQTMDDETIIKLSEMIKSFPQENFDMNVPDSNGNIICLRDLYNEILPRLNEIKERKAYDNEIDGYITNRDH